MGKATRVCALDLGKSRVGLAVADESLAIAHPRGVLPFADRKRFLRELMAFVVREEVGRIVVGLPVDMSGEERATARDVREVGQQIADETGLEVELWDERWTTKQAARELRSSSIKEKDARKHIDEASAVAILEGWLHARAAKRKRKKDGAP